MHKASAHPAKHTLTGLHDDLCMTRYPFGYGYQLHCVAQRDGLCILHGHNTKYLL